MKPAALLAFLAASSAATAFACSCARGLYLTLPETDQSGVPANTRIYVGDAAGPGADLPGGAPPPVLLDAAGAEVPVEHSTLQSGFGALRVLTPSSPLQVGQRYTVEIEAYVVTTFVVAIAADTEAPPMPQVVDTDGSLYYGSGGGDCGDSFWAQYTVQAQGPLLLLDRDGTARYEPASVSGSVTSIARTERAGPTLASVGQGGCGGNWAEATAGSTARTRFAVIDLAGNFSGWSAFEESSIPLVGCGCSGAAGLSAFALAGLLARRRRSR